MAWIPIAAVIVAFGSSALAAVSTKCPFPDLCFGLEFPDVTLASGTGDIFLQITAPATYASITLAHHNRPNSTQDYFFVATNGGKSDLAISRIIVNGQVDFGGAFKRLQRSGIADGKTTASIRCSTCDSKSGGSMELTTPIEAWNWTFRAADASSTTLVSGRFHFDPLERSLSTQTRPLNAPLVNRAAPAGHANAFRGPPAQIVHMAMAHAILACVAWAFIFPLGGILIRSCSFRKVLWVHACLQIFGLCLYTVAIGLGINLGFSPRHKWIKSKHAIIGLTIYGLFLTQAASGYIHHLMFKRYLSRTTWSYIHLWTGRMCITLALINAGFGFQLRNQGFGSWKVISYMICAVFMWVAYVTSIVVGEWRRKKQNKEATFALETGNSTENAVSHVSVIEETPKRG